MVNGSKPSACRFVPYQQLNGSPNIIIDGAATRGTVLTLSHWPKSGTPVDLRRDTSSEAVFAYLDSTNPHPRTELLSNDHFDEDGLIGIFTLINPAIAEQHRDLLMDAANAGDFGVFKHRDAARIAFTIAAHADRKLSLLPKEIFAMPYPPMAGRLYEEILAIMPRILTDLVSYKQFWEAEDAMLAASEELIECGQITIEERPELDLAIVCIPEILQPQPVHQFTQTRLAECHPFAINNRTNRSRVLIVRGQHIAFHYRYESWVQFVSRRPLPRIDLKDLARELNNEEISGGLWVFDGVERITPQLHLEGSSATSIPPATIRKRLEHHLATGAPAWDPYD